MIKNHGRGIVSCQTRDNRFGKINRIEIDRIRTYSHSKEKVKEIADARLIQTTLIIFR